MNHVGITVIDKLEEHTWLVIEQHESSDEVVLVCVSTNYDFTTSDSDPAPATLESVPRTYRLQDVSLLLNSGS